MASEFTGKEYVDLAKVDRAELKRQKEAGNSRAALLDFIIDIFGFNRGQPVIDILKAREALVPFLKDPLCASAYATSIFDDGHAGEIKVRRTKAEAIVTPQVGQAVLEEAKENGYYAIYYAARLLARGLGVRTNFNLAEMNMRKLSAPRAGGAENSPSSEDATDAAGANPPGYVFSIEDATSPGDAVARQTLGAYLEDKAKYLASGPKVKKAYLDDAAIMHLAAANGGIAVAQCEVGAYYSRALDAEPFSNPVVSGKDREELSGLAEKYFLLADRQGQNEARLELAKLYEKTGRYEEAKPLYGEFAAQNPEAKFGLIRLLDREKKYREAFLLSCEVAQVPHLDALRMLIAYRTNEAAGDEHERNLFAYHASITILEWPRLGIPAAERTELLSLRSALFARTWIRDASEGLRHLGHKDNPFRDKGLLFFIPEDSAVALDWLRGEAEKELKAAEAEKRTPQISLDLSLELAERHAKGEGLKEPDPIEALRWHRYAAEVHDSSVAMTALALRSEDLVEALRCSLALLSRERRQGQGISGDTRRSIQNRQNEIYNEDPPRVWLVVPQQPPRPIIPSDTNFNEAEMVPADPAEALAWYERATSAGSPKAAAIVKKLKNPAGAVEDDAAQSDEAELVADLPPQPPADEEIPALSPEPETLPAEPAAIAVPPPSAPIEDVAEQLYLGTGGREQDLITALRLCREELSKEQIPERVREMLRAIQSAILEPPEGDPQIWIRDPEFILRPAAADDDLDLAEVVPAGDVEATAWYQAATDAESFSAVLVLAERFNKALGTDRRLEEALSLSEALKERIDSEEGNFPFEKQHERLAALRESILDQAWSLSAEDVLSHWRKSADRKTEVSEEQQAEVSEEQPMVFLPANDEEALDTLKDRLSQSNDVKIEYAWRLARGIGCERSRQAEALGILTQAMILLENSGRAHVLRNDFPRAEQILCEWDRLVEVVKVRRNRGSNSWTYSVPGNSEDSFVGSYSANFNNSVELFFSRQSRRRQMRIGNG